jgi:hypothetical protein
MAVAVVNVIAPSGLIARLAFAGGLIHAPADFPALINRSGVDRISGRRQVCESERNASPVGAAAAHI